MFQTVKQHLLVTVLLTQATSLLFGDRLPYFPIEISRTAASHPTSYYVLVFGTLTCFGYISKYVDRPEMILSWLGMCVLAIFDDVNHWSAHMFGVLVMMLGVSTNIYLRSEMSDNQKLAYIICIFILLRQKR